EWLSQRLLTVSLTPPHYENSWYGPVTGLLTTYFPTGGQFLVKPQARLRQPPAPGALRTSTDSYGQTTSHADNNDPIPDFVVCVGSATAELDIPFLILEVKRDEKELAAMSVQQKRYTDWLENY
ncbi:hypothetical protein BJ138DRAFT_966139, partial [Hygrophoropsis aurantiaca]